MNIYRCEFIYPTRLPHSHSDTPALKKYQINIAANNEEEIRDFFERTGKKSEIWAHMRLCKVSDETNESEGILLQNLKSHLQKIVDSAVRL